ncbi:MAG: hypothetical protein AAGI46_04535 [Planctomycetota bacterium]
MNYYAYIRNFFGRGVKYIAGRAAATAVTVGSWATIFWLIWDEILRTLHDVILDVYDLSLDILEAVGFDRTALEDRFDAVFDAVDTAGDALDFLNLMLPVTEGLFIILGGLAAVFTIRMIRHLLGAFPTLSLG